MAPRSYLVAAAALVLLASGLTVARLWPGTPSQQTVLTPPHPQHHLQSEGGKEWMESDYFDAFGKKVTTRVSYQNGVMGIRYLRDDLTVSHEVARLDSGLVVLAVEYAADGLQVVTGYKLRTDGTAVWHTSMDEKRFIKTTTYWGDGKHVFSVQRRRLGSPNVDETYFHENGKRSMHYVGSVDRSSAPSTAEVWNEAGQLLFTHYTGLNDTSKDTVYRDGIRWYGQTWARRAVQPSEADPSTRAYLLLKVELFDAKGELGREYIMASDGHILQRVVDHVPRGNTKELSVTYDGTISTAVQTDASGRSLPPQTVSTPRHIERAVLETQFRENRVGQFDPATAWRAAEDVWSF